MKIDKESYLTLWDAPPLGDPERLFPNQITDSDPKTIARKVTAGTHCYGAPDTFPLFQDPKEGAGPGKELAIDLGPEEQGKELEAIQEGPGEGKLRSARTDGDDRGLIGPFGNPGFGGKLYGEGVFEIAVFAPFVRRRSRRAAEERGREECGKAHHIQPSVC